MTRRCFETFSNGGLFLLKSISMTLNQYIDNLGKMKQRDPLKGESEIIYSVDEEGNAYRKSFYEPSFCQIEDMKQYNLELVGFEGGENISLEDCNAICIN